MNFTLYELGKDLHGRALSGRDRQEMRASLERLFEARFELEGYDAASARLGRLEDSVESGFDFSAAFDGHGTGSVMQLT